MSILVVIGAGVFLLICLRLLRNGKCVGIIVYGDIGRSPRMQYHAISLAQTGYSVIIFSLGGSTPHKILLDNPNISISYLHQFPCWFKEKLPTILYFASKVFWQTINLFFILMIRSKPSKYILQNPPSLPAMGVCWLVCFLKSNELIIDWHNYGYTLMALSLNPQHLIVKLYKKFEFFFGKMAQKHICVSNSMKHDLKNKYQIEAETLYDRAPDIFDLQPLAKRHSFYQKLNFSILNNENNLSGNLFTEIIDEVVCYKEKRPVLIVSSTSWTADENFDILFDAFDGYDKMCSSDENHFPKIICVITGKGPLKDDYMKKCLNRWNHVSVFAPWLTAEDYPLLLGSADLGICLHYSSSGLDLPMKVVDMFGCGLPVCAIKYQCIEELVEDKKTGLLFSNSGELTDVFKVLYNFPSEKKKLRELSLNILKSTKKRWHENWTEVVLPLIKDS